eukprot:8711226-Alexandrium_andersonii.AAC.1
MRCFHGLGRGSFRLPPMNTPWSVSCIGGGVPPCGHERSQEAERSEFRHRGCSTQSMATKGTSSICDVRATAPICVLLDSH